MVKAGLKVFFCRPSKSDFNALVGMWGKVDSKGKHKIFGLEVERPGTNPFRNIYIIKDAGSRQIIAYCNIHTTPEHPEKIARISDFVVRPDLRRRGIGKKLIGEINSFLVSSEVTYAHLSSSVEGFSFYPKTNWGWVPKNGVVFDSDFEWFPKKDLARIGSLKKKIKPPVFGFSPTNHAKKYKRPLRIA